NRFVSDVMGLHCSELPRMKWSALFVDVRSRTYPFVTHTVVAGTFAHSPLPPLKLLFGPRITFSVKPLARLPSGSQLMFLRLYEVFRPIDRLRAGVNEKLPRTPPSFCPFVRITPFSLFALAERKYVMASPPPRTLSDVRVMLPCCSHVPLDGQVGSTN